MAGNSPVSYDAEAYPERIAPFLGNHAPGVWLPGTFGILPHWADPTLARRTYNARSETVTEKPSFRHAWRARQLAVAPVQAFYERSSGRGRTAQLGGATRCSRSMPTAIR